MSSYEVKIHDIRKREDRGKSKSYRLRWVVSGNRCERSFTTKALADGFRNDLLRAAKEGTPFDERTGLPETIIRDQKRETWLEHVRSYVEMKWPNLAAKSRRSTVEALVTVTAYLVTAERGAPDRGLLHKVLYQWALNPNAWGRELADDEREAFSWLARASRPVVELAKPDVVRGALNACARRLDGRPAAPTTVQRKRAVFYNALGYAVERELLDYNPLDKIAWKAPSVAETVDRRVVANTAQVEAILSVVPEVHRNGDHYVAFFGCLYYAAMRPAEAASLRRADCVLPVSCLDCGEDLSSGATRSTACEHVRQQAAWGRLVLAETEPYAGSGFTDDGKPRQRRGLKHRGEHETRPVAIPPELVRLLHAHLVRHGTTEDGRLFRGARGGHLSDSTYDRIWKDARAKALTREQVLSPLMGRPYDLRHAAVSLWLNGGVPATEVARRAGHSVAVLLRVYANCIDGEEETVNAKIAAALSTSRGRGRTGGRTSPRRPARPTKVQVRRAARRVHRDAL